MGKYQLLPPLSTAEYEALREDIAVAGVLVPIDVDEHGDILDGHHRKQACDELGIECPTRLVQIPDFAKADYALTVNLARRHLDQKQRRQLVWNSVKDAPNLSDRLHARRCGVSPSTVAAVRSDLVAAELVSNPDTRQDRRGRQQPATKKTAAGDTHVPADEASSSSTSSDASAAPPSSAETGMGAAVTPTDRPAAAPGDEDGGAPPSDAQPPAGDVSNDVGSDETEVQDEAPRQSSDTVDLPQEQETTWVSVPAPAGDPEHSGGSGEQGRAAVSVPAPAIPSWLAAITAVCTAVHDLDEQDPLVAAEAVDDDLAAELGSAVLMVTAWYRQMQEAK